MKKLSTKQRNFLQYMNDVHYGLGWHLSIQMILRSGEYSSGLINEILNEWYGFVDNFKLYTKIVGMDYGNPIKYLKYRNDGN